MRTRLIILLWLSVYAVSAQQILITNRKTGNEINVYSHKVKVVVNKDGEFFKGKVRPFPTYLSVGEHHVAYEEIGFLEVKKLNGRSFISQPLKWIGTAIGVVGAAVCAIAVEGDEENLGQGGAGVLMMGGGVLLLSLGEKTKPSKNSKRKVLHTSEWHFSYLLNSEQ